MATRDESDATPLGCIAISNATIIVARSTMQPFAGDGLCVFLRGKSRSVLVLVVLVVESLVAVSPNWWWWYFLSSSMAVSLLMLWVRNSFSSSLGVR
jgi:hypothetical protein